MEQKTQKQEASKYLSTIALIIESALFILFPLVVTTMTTEQFFLPKQITLSIATLCVLLIIGAKFLSEGKIQITRTPFDFPLVLLFLSVLVSSILSVNHFDALTQTTPFLLGLVSYFLITNSAKNKSSIMLLLSSYLLGASLCATVSILSFVKVYLPPPFPHNQSFTLFGSLFDHLLYLGLSLPAAVSVAFFNLAKANKGRSQENASQTNKILTGVLFSCMAGVIFVSLCITGYQLLSQMPPILPFETGLQTGFAAISQDTNRILKSFLFGTGFGTYFLDFTRFKQASWNFNPTLWNTTFFRSSSFALELLPTVGVLGLASFFFLLYRIAKQCRQGLRASKDGKINPFTISLTLAAIASLLLPFSFVEQITLFFLLALFAILAKSADHEDYFDVELHFVAFKNTLLPLATSPVETRRNVPAVQKNLTKALPVSLFLIITIFVLVVGFFAYQFSLSDVLFQKSLIAASANNGLETYNNQTNAVKIFPYRDAYHRIYSQTNLALANSLASSQKGATPSAQTQQTIVTLIQQAINAGRNATTISPQTAVNWQSLSAIYRSLIGFGQNADSFAILTQQQAVALDPTNPQEYLDLGGIYYQLGQWENAQRQFQVTVSLKPDFANGYYNLGHSLEQKGDLKNALAQYEQAKKLLENDKASTKKISEEIDTLQKKIENAQIAQGSGTASTQQTPLGLTQANQKLGISTPSAQLPQQQTPVKIPPPTNATSSAK